MLTTSDNLLIDTLNKKQRHKRSEVNHSSINSVKNFIKMDSCFNLDNSDIDQRPLTDRVERTSNRSIKKVKEKIVVPRLKIKQVGNLNILKTQVKNITEEPTAPRDNNKKFGNAQHLQTVIKLKNKKFNI